MTAVSMPGSRKSIVYCWRPFDFGAESYRGNASLQMYFHSFGSFRATLAGTGPLAALAANAPYVADFPEAWLTMPFSALISLPGTFQLSTAAAISIARAVAPARR